MYLPPLLAVQPYLEPQFFHSGVVVMTVGQFVGDKCGDPWQDFFDPSFHGHGHWLLWFVIDLDILLGHCRLVVGVRHQ